MTTERLSWLLCGWALLVLLHGAIESLAQVSASRVEAELRQEEIARLGRAGYEVALRKLSKEPFWSGQLPELSDGSLRCRVKVANHLDSFCSSYEGRTWLAPHATLVEGEILTEPSGSQTSPFQNVLEPSRPTFSEGAAFSDPGPFIAPLPAAPAGRRVLKGKQTLSAGAYDEVVVAEGAELTLVPSRERYTFRLRSFWLAPGATLKVVGDSPAVLYVGESLVLESCAANEAGRAAMLQIYLLASGEMRIKDCRSATLVAAGPSIRASRSEIHGALRAASLQLEESQVVYEEALRGLRLEGLGPLRFRDPISP